MNRPARTLTGVPRRARRAVAHPDDNDLLLLLRGVVLSPPAVFNRDVLVEYTAEYGLSQSDGEMIAPMDDPFTGRLAASFSYRSLDEGQFTWLVETLDEWAVARTHLVYAAARGRLAAFYAPDETMLPFPAL